jgi:niacin transporter
MKSMKTKKFTTIALLVALAIVIPYAVFFKVIIPPFTATIGSHVPMFIAMFLGPEAAILVGLGSALGFAMNLGPLVGARAFMHVFVGLAGSLMIKKGISYKWVVIITAPIHGLLEVAVITPFIDFNAYSLFIVTGVGTMLHHGVDAIISGVLIKVLRKARLLDFEQKSELKQS